MRRLPVYMLVDVSGSMSGEPIESVKSGLQMLVDALRKEPRALETAYLSVITFNSRAQQIVPLTDLASFQLPEITASGCTALGEALKLLCDCRKKEIIKTTTEVKGDWKPMVFILTDGIPTDDDDVLSEGISEFHAEKWGAAVSCAAGPDADKDFLDKVTPECVVELATADKSRLSAFFKWVTASIATTSKGINEQGDGATGLGQLPPPPPELTIV